MANKPKALDWAIGNTVWGDLPLLQKVYSPFVYIKLAWIVNGKR